MSAYDIAGFVTGAICVYLLVRNSIWNWPWGILNAGIFLVSFWTAGLFADSALQVVYLALNGYGWWAWLHGGAGHAQLPITRLRTTQWLLSLVGIAVLAAVFATVLKDMLGSTVPVFDGLTTALSLVAMFWQTRRAIENWWFWICADVIYVPLYVYKHLPLTGLLYVIFFALCIAGIVRWRAEMDQRSSKIVTPPPPSFSSP